MKIVAARRLWCMILLLLAVAAAGTQQAMAREARRDRANEATGGPTPPAPPQSSNGFGVTHQGLSGKRDTIWTTNDIPVCWENPQANDATERGWVQSTVAATWEAASLVHFTGWGTCAGASKGVRIRTGSDYHPHTEGLGSDLAGKGGGMKLNFFWDGCGGSAHQQCVQFVAAHEFGHALGFSHEQNRPDAPPWCREEKQGTTGDIYITAYDPQSIMNYCSTSWNNGGRLSASDIAGVQVWYGPSPSSGLAWMPDCRNDVVLYQDINFGGRAVQIIGTMDSFGIIDFNDRASSVCVPAGIVLKLFEHDGFGGRTQTLAGPTMQSRFGSDWNDRVSSVQMIDARSGAVVFAAPKVCDGGIVLFQDSFFRGKNVPISGTIKNFKSVGFNDAASSLCVPAGRSITVFRDADFKNQSLTFVGPAFRTNLDTMGWNDVASSVTVR